MELRCNALVRRLVSFERAAERELADAERIRAFKRAAGAAVAHESEAARG